MVFIGLFYHVNLDKKFLDSVSPDEYVRIRSVASFMIREADDGCRRFLKRNYLCAISKRIITELARTLFDILAVALFTVEDLLDQRILEKVVKSG